MQETKSYSNYFKSVKEYIQLEYDDTVSKKMDDPKFANVISGYVRNCLSLKKTIPNTAGILVKFLSTTK